LRALSAALARRGNLAGGRDAFYNSVRRSGTVIERTGSCCPSRWAIACGVSVFPHAPAEHGGPVFLIEHAPYFERDDPKTGRGLYQYQTWAATGLRRQRRTLCVLLPRRNGAGPHVGFPIDVSTRNDWQPVHPHYSRKLTATTPAISASVGVHDSQHRVPGSYPRELLNYTGLPGWLYNPNQLDTMA